MERKTKDGLPTVSTKTIEIFLRDVSKRGDEGTDSHRKHIHDLVKELSKKNLKLMEFWVAYMIVHKLEEKGIARDYMSGAMATYELLRRQAESDKMEKMLG